MVSGVASRLGRVRSDFQAAHHEVHERVPIDKKHIAGEGAQVIEQHLPRWQSRADQTIVLVAKVQEGVVMERQNVHRRQTRRNRSEESATWSCSADGALAVVALVIELDRVAVGIYPLGQKRIQNIRVAIQSQSRCRPSGNSAPRPYSMAAQT
jgi:hypothetical protein